MFSNVCKYSRHLYSGTFHTSDFCITHPPLKTTTPSLMSNKSVKPDKLLAVQQDVKEVKVRTNKISLDLESHKRNVRKQNLEQKRLEMKGWCVVSGSSVPAKMKGEKITPLVTMLIQKAFNVNVPFSEIQDAYRLGTNRRIMVK